MCVRIRKGVHDTGCLPIEVAVTYPFHPFAGQTVLIIGHVEHAGIRHLITRPADGSAVLLPAWMTAPEAGLIRIRDNNASLSRNDIDLPRQNVAR